MAAGLIIVPNFMPAFDLNGNPLAGALMNFYVDNTTTRATVYQDPEFSAEHPNPVPADSSGAFPAIYADDSATYTVVVTDKNGLPQTNGTLPGVGVSLQPFGYVNIREFWGPTDNFSSALQKAVNTHKHVIIPYSATAYLLTTTILYTFNQSIEFEGDGQVVTCMADFAHIGAGVAYSYNIRFKGNGAILNFAGAPTYGSFKFMASSGLQRDIYADDFADVNSAFMITQDGLTLGCHMFRCKFNNLYHCFPAGPGYTIRNPQGFVEMAKCVEDRTYNDDLISYTQYAASTPAPVNFTVNWKGFDITSSSSVRGGGIQIRGDCGVFGMGYGGNPANTNPASTALHVEYQQSPTVEDFLSDSLNALGADVSFCDNGYYEIQCYNTRQGGATFTTNTNSQFGNLSFIGGDLMGAVGVRFTDEYNAQGLSIEARSWGGNAVVFAGGKYIQFGLIKTVDNAGQAITLTTFSGDTPFLCSIDSLVLVNTLSGNSNYMFVDQTTNSSVSVGRMIVDNVVSDKNYSLGSRSTAIMSVLKLSGAYNIDGTTGALVPVIGNGTLGGVTG